MEEKWARGPTFVEAEKKMLAQLNVFLQLKINDKDHRRRPYKLSIVSSATHSYTHARTHGHTSPKQHAWRSNVTMVTAQTLFKKKSKLIGLQTASKSLSECSVRAPTVRV